VPAQTPEKLADAIDLIIADKKLARSMGTAGRKRVEDFFTFDKMMRQYKKIYTELMK
jgi:glycosyltransferase involved in cell wall biosynthesis